MSNGFRIVRLGEVLTPVERPERPVPGKAYRQVGVKLWGQGAYERDPIDGAQTRYRALWRVETGDIILNKIWARNGSVAVVPESLAGRYVSNEFPTFAAVREKLEPRWLHWLTKTRIFWEQCDRKSRGTSGKNRIRPERFLEIEIPLPPLAEQQRIVTRIEELAARITEARRVRQQAVEEALVLDNSLPTHFIPWNAPRKTLGQLIEPGSTISYGVLVPGPDVEGGVPFVRVQDLKVRCPPVLPRKRVAPEVDAQYARTRLRGGEVLVGVVGSIGKVGIAPPSWAGANIARAVCRIVPGPEIGGQYLAIALQSPEIQHYFGETTRTLAQPTLNVGQLEQTPIPVPETSEQLKIVTYLENLHTRLDVLKGLQAGTAAELDALLLSILDKAFKGEL